MWQTNTYVNGVPKEQVRLHLTENCCSGHNHIFKDINKSITSSSQTKVHLPPECNLPQKEININNKLTVEPPRKIKAYILYNFILWIITTIIFSSLFTYMYLQLLAVQKNTQYLEATVLDITSKYEYLIDSVNNLNNNYESVITKQEPQIQFEKDSSDINKPNTQFNKANSYLNNNARDQNDLDHDRINDSQTVLPSARRNQPRPPKSDVTFAHFKGALPVADIKSEGLIGPWILDESVTGTLSLAKFRLLPGSNAIEIREPGLYMLYAQVYYEDSHLSNSYAISVEYNGKVPQSMAYCSTSAQNIAKDLSEISCYTSIVTYLPKGVTIHLQQHQKNRRILMRDGYSFMGLVKLNAESSSLNRPDSRRQ